MPAVNRVQKHEEAAACGTTQALRETFDEYPISSVFVAFGIGLGVGTLLGCALGGSPEPEHVATRLGRRVLDSISDYMPESLRR